MIKFEFTEVMNFAGAFRGMRNAYESWELSDSEICPNSIGFEDCTSNCGKCPRDDGSNFDKEVFCIGKNDLALAQKLIKAGSDHRKFMRQIIVSVDITAPLYWWKEFDTYKVGTVANSCSTMHKIPAKEFTLDNFSTEKLLTHGLNVLRYIINELNDVRELYINGFQGVPGDDSRNIPPKDKRYWWQMIQLLPTSYNQRRTLTLNYEVLRNIYGSRRNHKLDEWSIGFMKWLDSLPYAEELIKYEI